MSDEVGYLIETSFGSRGPHWLRVVLNSTRMGGTPQLDWTPHSELAMRFCRNVDAEMFWHLHPVEGVIPLITEHAWVKP